MRYPSVTALAAALALSLPMAALAQGQSQDRQNDFSEQARQLVDRGMAAASGQQAERVIRDWPDASREAARAMIQRYGQPDETSNMALVWVQNDPWHHTMVLREPVQHNFPMPHEDVLAQTVFLDVPEGKFDDIARFDGSVILDRTKGTITARCDSEEANTLAINLARRISNDDLDVEEAREEYARLMRNFQQDGRRNASLRRLQFEPASAASAGDPDERFEGFAMQDDEREDDGNW